MDKNALKQIGVKIRNRRFGKGVSTQTLAEKSGMDYSQISRMELGKVNFSISHLFRIAMALGTPPKRLLP